MRHANDFESQVAASIASSIAAKQRLLTSDGLVAEVAAVSQLLVEAFQQGHKAILFGNGGSAADAQHIAAEFVGRFAFDRPALPALALSVNTSCLTAIGNDYGFEVVFARQLEALAQKGDVAIGITTSGNSPNVLKALETARKMQLHTIALTGASGGKAVDVADHCIRVPSAETPRIQECHILIGHIISDLVERTLFHHRAVFLDRDGVINQRPPEGDYVTRWEQFRILPGVPEAISRLKQAGFRVIVVTNQRCVAKGLITTAELESIHARMRDVLAEHDAEIDAIYYCPHELKPACECRKPAIGMLLDAANAHNIDLLRSWMVGDSDIDITAGKNAGCRTARVMSNGQTAEVKADLVSGSLADAVEQILREGCSVATTGS